ncbi:glycosyltransferase [Elioraea sp.]|uniref:glycosyltransferase n=1 Tax=Elioraea sp. TaxID=2185103 RepID=UPI00307D239C
MILDIPHEAFWPLFAVGGLLLLVRGIGSDRLARATLPPAVALIVAHYLVWRFAATLEGPGLGPADHVFIHAFLGVELLALADGMILMLMLSRRRDNSAEADRHERRLAAADPASLPAVDVFIATYNEPLEVLERTIIAALALDWPNLRVWVLDDGRRDWLRRWCADRGAGYLTRPDNKGAKAGNINAALARTSAPFVLVLDADFAPRANFLRRTMGFFADPRVGIVQAPHRFFNPDPMQQNLRLHRVLPDDQRLFFDVIMPARDAWDAAFCCGSNGVIRRSALAEVGGRLPEGSITEDMLLTLVLLRKGYVTRYLNETLALGLAPESTDAFFVQRARWARGAIQILHLRHGPLGPGLGLLHRLFFLPTHWLSGSLVQSFSLIAPVLFMLTGIVPIANVGVPEVLTYQLPVVVGYMGSLQVLSRGAYHPLAALVLSAFSAVRLLPAVLVTLVRPHGHAFRVTPKGRDAVAGGVDRLVAGAALALTAATALGLVLNAVPAWRIVERAALIPVVAGWSVANAVVLLLVAAMAIARPPARAEERFAMGGEPAVLVAGEARLPAALVDLSLSGALLRPEGDCAARPGDRVAVEIAGVLPLAASVAGVRPTGIGLRFEAVSDEARAALIRRLFSEAHEPVTAPAPRENAAVALLARLFLGDPKPA